jgi:hypothetical protein
MFDANTSPSDMPSSPNLRIAVSTCGPKVPVKSVRPFVCATTWPRASVRPQAKSSTS